MTSEQQKSPRSQGKMVWQSVIEQMAEGGGFLHAMFQSVKDFIRKYILSFLIYGLIAGIISVAIWYLVPKVYKADMTVSYVHYEKKIYADMLEKLNQLIQTKSYLSLSKQLGLSTEEVQLLSSIKAFNIRREPLIEDLSTEKIPFYIEVCVHDISVLPALEMAVVEYMNGTEFIQERLKYMQQKNEEELIFLQNRIISIDSLSQVLTVKNQKLSEEDAVNRMDLLQETLAIYDRMQNVKGALAFNKNIEVLDGFIASEKPAGKSIFYWIVYGFLVGVGLRFIVIIFK